MHNVQRQNRKRPDPLLKDTQHGDSENTSSASHDGSELDMYKRRAWYSATVLVVFFSIIIARLWFFQVTSGETYREKAQNNRVRSLEIAAPRGNILDRKGREVVTNRPSFNVVWVREDNKIEDAWLKRVSRILGKDISEMLPAIQKMSSASKHIPVRLAEDVDWETMAQVEKNRMHLPGVKIEVVPLRVYHYGNLASHMIGYLGQISKRKLQKVDPKKYKGGDIIGKMGLELLREDDLRGDKGKKLMEVNARGFEQRYLQGGYDPMPGNDIQLTLDVDLQQTAEQLMIKDGKTGAVVAMEANTGRILVLASTPVLPLDKFVGGISKKVWDELNDPDNPHKPLVNKATQGQYPPGSTYKLITATAGLAENIINKDTVIYCPGRYRFGNRTYHCWKRGGHGPVNLKRALSESCDVYFYQVGQRLGVDRLAKYARMFGLGTKTGIEMEHEKSGLIPTAAWKKKRWGQVWQEGETLSVAIGQGFNLATPLQLASMTATLANGGVLYQPALVETVRGPDGTVLEQFKPVINSRLTGMNKILRLVREGLVETVEGRRGTARNVRLQGKTIKVGGKTGTAQVVRLKQYKHLKEEDIPYKYRDHALFVCFAPAKNPEIVVAVIVEHGLHGGWVAPIARTILEKYFEGRYDKEKP